MSIVLALSLELLLAAPLSQEARPEWPTKGWPISTPAAQGVDASVLKSIDEELQKSAYGYVDSMLIIRNGFVVLDAHYEHDYRAANEGHDQTSHQFNYHHADWHPFYQGSELHTLQSATKSWASTMIGVALHQGAIEGTDVAALSFFSDREFPDPDGRKARIRLVDVLTMRSGFEWDEWSFGLDDPRNDCITLEGSDDWISYLLNKPMAADPGTVFVYNSGSSHLLSGIIRKATGKTIDEYAEEQLFGPLGIEAYHWKKTPKGLPDTEGGLYLKPTDLAKLGLLFLRDGVWEGKRLLPEGWVERSTTPWVTDIAPDNSRRDPGYGYQWWILDDGEGDTPKLFAAMGYGGQYLYVVPELELIGVFTGWNIYGPTRQVQKLFQGRIVPVVN